MHAGMLATGLAMPTAPTLPTQQAKPLISMQLMASLHNASQSVLTTQPLRCSDTTESASLDVPMALGAIPLPNYA